MQYALIYYRISGYVDEANETIAEKREKLKVLKKHHPKPELSYLTIGSYIMVGKKTFQGYLWCLKGDN